MKFREYRVLRISFWTKLAFIFIELALVIAFGVQNYRDKYNSGKSKRYSTTLRVSTRSSLTLSHSQLPFSSGLFVCECGRRSLPASAEP